MITTYDQAFSGKLVFLIHEPTGAMFVANTGSIPNLITERIVK